MPCISGGATKKGRRQALPVATDVRKPEQIDALVERAIAEFGQIDLLINNAGGSYQGAIESWKVGSAPAPFEIKTWPALPVATGFGFDAPAPT